MAQNFTEAAQNAIQEAFRDAQDRKNTEVTENHLLLAFLSDPQGYFISVLSNLKANSEKLIQDLEENLSRLATFSGPSQEPPAAGRSFISRIADAESIAKKWNDSFISSDHFLLSFWKNGG